MITTWYANQILAGGVSGDISGTASITFGQSGALAAPSGSMSGTAALTFGQSATIVGTGTLSGTAPLAFSQSGTLSGVASLSGTASFVFGQSGTLSAPSGDISGTASIVFGQFGNLVAVGQVSQEPRFIGDGVYSGHERASQERMESRDRLREIVARSYDKVVGIKASAASPQEVPKATKSQRRNIATRAFTEIKTEGLLDALENIGDLIAKYEAAKRTELQTYDDDLMMVMLLA